MRSVSRLGDIGAQPLRSALVARLVSGRLGPNEIDASALVEGIGDLVVVVDDQLVVTWCNLAMTTMLGWEPDEVVGLPISNLVHPDDITNALAGIEHLQNEHEIYRVGLRLRARSDQWVSASVTGLDHSNDPRIRGMVLTVRSAEQHTKDLGDLQRQTRTDQLTGLANRQSLHDRLQAVTFLDRPDAAAADQLTACFVDLDKFKHVNDIHGHRIGDQVLAAAARRLQAYAIEGDILARHGGDEFVLVLADTTRASNARDIGEEIRTSLAQPFGIDGNIVHLTASVGIASHRFDSLDPGRLLQEADIALYAAKEQGRDRVVEFDQPLAAAAQRQQQQRSMVRRALMDDGFAVHFQPIVTSDLVTVGVEALVRCVADDGSVIKPAEFLTSVTGTSMAVELDHRVFEISCAAARRLASQAPNLWVSCNVAPNTLAQGDFSDRILDAIDAAGGNPANICLEVTETAAFEAGPTSLRALERLGQKGVTIALDDFGTGFSSLSHLLQLPLSRVKIDQSFVALVHSDGPEHAITRGATDLAHSLGCQVVAEGVETEGQLGALRGLGVDLMQGWLFAPALSFEDLVARVVRS